MKVVSAWRTRRLIAASTVLVVMLQGYMLWSSDYTIDALRSGSSAAIRQMTSRLTDLRTGKNTKLILAYTQFYGTDFEITKYAKFGKKGQKVIENPLSECDHSCEWSTDRADYYRSDVVLFHLYNNLKNKDFILRQLPKRYKDDQKWILIIREPPAFYYPEQLKLLNNTFNLSMTYQSDSDIVIPYGWYWKNTPSEVAKMEREKVDHMKGKNKTVVWLVSNCITSSRREEYVNELKRHIDVDIFGGCGNKSAADNTHADKFRRVLSMQYKFYIAFENSDCDEYITEKLWRNLRLGMIPIVRGRRARYEKFAPPNSYIHADSFLNAKQLADYLKEVASNSTLFHKYHEWRIKYNTNYKTFTINRNWLCDICDKAHEKERKTLDVYQHFSEDTRCFTYLDHLGRNRTGEHVEDIDRV
ncbi:4-galactosyl-N-acetylglucosaminide 3-alpha-L-fucosyltransferase FUT6-like [Watersipora subatra]|uniref:4-galactosyl-N-acetylglucosaminide 3-alpha-L-fucosyltransferase FUT6-like n=1 Tax=Watersipora subatra TaxID=2589382 RepID=UPI00355B7AB0